MNNREKPDFTFQGIDYGKHETPLSLNALLYKGGAEERPRNAAKTYANLNSRFIAQERVALIGVLYEQIKCALENGGSIVTTHSQIYNLRKLFRWADDSGMLVNINNLTEIYLNWSDHLLAQARLAGGISASTAYIRASYVGTLIDKALENPTPIIQSTSLRMPNRNKDAIGISGEKASIEAMGKFGKLIQEICDQITIENLTSGKQITIKQASGSDFKINNRGLKNKITIKDGAEALIENRGPTINIRIEAELMMFVAQTGMNATQASKIAIDDFAFSSHLDGCQVRCRKNRRHGEVLFEIFSEYKPHFERYLAWRRKIIRNQNSLFPFIRTRGPASHSRFQGERLRKICSQIGCPYVPPQHLRNLRVNWLLRKSQDEDLTSEMSQHSKESLIRYYERPSLQATIVQTINFWNRHDPHRMEESLTNGFCNGSPRAIEMRPDEATEPDCIRPSGCLWCDQHRDLDSLDYVWSLASFQYIKSIELARWNGPSEKIHSNPALISLEQISRKIAWFEESTDTHKEWASEARMRIQEGLLHPHWADIAKQLEI